MENCNLLLLFHIAVFTLLAKWSVVSAFHFSLLRHRSLPSCFSRNDHIWRRSTRSEETESRLCDQNVQRDGYSIRVADSRDSVVRIELYRFGGKTVEEHMEAKPELTSRDDALRWLTRTYDDDGKGKVYFGNGSIGESVQFFALADELSSFLSEEGGDGEDLDESLLRTRGVLGSIEVVKEPTEDGTSEADVSFELKNLSVHTKARRRGIGKALTQVVQDYARQETSLLQRQEERRVQGIVHLLVESDNDGAVRLYKESGFVGDSDDEGPLCEMKWLI